MQRVSWLFGVHILLLLITFETVNAQSVTYRPTSIQGWGMTRFASMLSVEYENFGVHYSQIHIPQQFNDSRTVDRAFAVSYVPFEIWDSVNLGVILFNKKFPTLKSGTFNFYIEANLPVTERVELTYLHVSNGFTATENYGLDYIGIRVNL